MRKVLYLFVKARLMEAGTCAHIDLWNEQMRFIQQDTPFALPAVFIEFLPIKWELLAGYEYEADVPLRLHVCTDSRVAQWEEAIAAFDFIDDILAALHGASDHTAGIGKMVRTASATSSMFDEIMHNVETYECHVVHKL